MAATNLTFRWQAQRFPVGVATENEIKFLKIN